MFFESLMHGLEYLNIHHRNRLKKTSKINKLNLNPSHHGHWLCPSEPQFWNMKEEIILNIQSEVDSIDWLSTVENGSQATQSSMVLSNS